MNDTACTISSLTSKSNMKQNTNVHTYKWKMCVVLVSIILFGHGRAHHLYTSVEKLHTLVCVPWKRSGSHRGGAASLRPKKIGSTTRRPLSSTNKCPRLTQKRLISTTSKDRPRLWAPPPGRSECRASRPLKMGVPLDPMGGIEPDFGGPNTFLTVRK